MASDTMALTPQDLLTTGKALSRECRAQDKKVRQVHLRAAVMIEEAEHERDVKWHGETKPGEEPNFARRLVAIFESAARMAVEARRANESIHRPMRLKKTGGKSEYLMPDGSTFTTTRDGLLGPDGYVDICPREGFYRTSIEHSQPIRQALVAKDITYSDAGEIASKSKVLRKLKKHRKMVMDHLKK